MSSQRTERGQAIVIVLLALLALMAFAALAVDGGQVYSERRRAQNAADAAAYAAAMAAIEGQDSIDAALAQAGFNSYGVDAVQVFNPPISGPYAGDDEYYQVVVTQDIQPSFAGLITNQDMEIRAEAVAHASPTTQITSGNAVHALEDYGVGIEFKGNVTVMVNGGNIFSNSGIEKKGGSGTVQVTNGDIYYTTGACAGCTKGVVTPNPQKSDGPMFIAAVPTPVCPSQAGVIDTNTKTLYPGTYNQNIDFKGGKGKGPWTMKPGMYCLNDGMKINGNESVIGKDIFVVLNGGEIRLNGGGKVRWTRASDLEDAGGNQWGGMLIYVPPTNHNEVFLSGNNETVFTGTILASESWCSFGGTSDALGLNANIICKEILFHGNPTIYVNYKEPQNYQLPPIVELSQ